MAKKKTKNSLAQALQNTKSSSSAAAVTVKQMTAQQLTMVTLFWFVAHSVIIYLANMMYPSSVVLGTHLVSPMMAILYSMGVFTLLSVGSIPVIELIANQLRIKMGALHWFGSFMAVNTVGLWVVARFAEQLGMGLSSWLVAVVVALIMDLAQGMLVQIAARE